MRIVRLSIVAGLLGLMVVVPTGIRSAEPERVRADEETVKQAGLGTDGPALLTFFRQRTPGADVQAKVANLVEDLGNDRFRVRDRATRELVVLGPVAGTLLRQALKNPDLEVVRRAERCLKEIDRSIQPDLQSAAARLLAHRAPPGTAEALLAYLPFAPDEYVGEELRTAIAQAGVHPGKPDEAILEALEAKQALLRGAAGEALARAGGEKERALARDLLKDQDIRVRVRVALALVERKEKEALGALVKMLPEVPDEQRWRIEQLLSLIAGEKAPASWGGSNDREWQAYCRAWSGWWRDQGDKLNLATLDLTQRQLGLTLIVQLDPRKGIVRVGGAIVYPGRVYEIGPDGRKRWEITDVNYPSDAQVIGPNRVLISEYRSRQITERDFKGKILWKKQFPSYVYGAKRLPNGNTLVNLRTQVVEVDRAGREVFRSPATTGTITGVGRTRNGQTVVVDYRGVCTYLDAAGKQVKTFNAGTIGLSGIGVHIDVLPSGNVLLPLYAQNKVVEFDSNGRKVREIPAQRPTGVSRLPSGNTLVFSRYTRQVEEFNREGKRVWYLQTDGTSVLCVRRR
jgi:hypothetical protein